jgi:hypothetical protein
MCDCGRAESVVIVDTAARGLRGNYLARGNGYPRQASEESAMKTLRRLQWSLVAMAPVFLAAFTVFGKRWFW